MDKRRASPWGEAPAKQVVRGYDTKDFPSSDGSAATFPRGGRLITPINPNLSKLKQRKRFVSSVLFLVKLALACIKLVVASFHFKELLVCAAFNDLALLKYHDRI